MRLSSHNQLSESDVQQVARFTNGLRYDIQAMGIGSSTYTNKTDTNQSSSTQLRGDAQVDHSKSTHEVDGGKKKTTTTTTSTHDRVNLAEGDKTHNESEDEGLIISPDAIFEDDDDHSEAFLGSSENIISWDITTHLKLTPKKHPKPYKPGWIKAIREQCDLNVVHKGKENTYTFSKRGRKFTLCPYPDGVQATTTKEKKNQIMLCSTRNNKKNTCATTILLDEVLYPIKNLWWSSFQEGENDGGPKFEKEEKKKFWKN
ncbi:hypothetical protein Tco_0518153 [Tanacetum coccineum]